MSTNATGLPSLDRSSKSNNRFMIESSRLYAALARQVPKFSYGPLRLDEMTDTNFGNIGFSYGRIRLVRTENAWCATGTLPYEVLSRVILEYPEFEEFIYPSAYDASAIQSMKNFGDPEAKSPDKWTIGAVYIYNLSAVYRFVLALDSIGGEW